MLMFGVDVPLVELIMVLIVIVVLLLIEVIVVMVITMKQMNKSKQAHELMKQMAGVLLQIKKEEEKTLMRFKR
jgi:hypothetical protein